MQSKDAASCFQERIQAQCYPCPVLEETGNFDFNLKSPSSEMLASSDGF